MHVSVDASVISWLREHLLDNEVVLFLGAGFSSDALNRIGEPIPTSGKLARQLYEATGFHTTRPFADEKLEDVFEAARLRLGEARLTDFLVPRLSVSEAPSWYGHVTKFFWYRMYTTNVDDVVETVWKSASDTAPDLSPIIGLDGDFSERDQLLGSLQYVKLNGSLDRGIKAITFSRRQYAARSADQDLWVDQFVRDYFTHPTVFIGTELEDPILWSYIERRERIERTKGRRDPRPKALLVSPEISPVKEPILESLHIEPVRAKASEFFEALHQELREATILEPVLRRVFARRRIPLSVAIPSLTRDARRKLANFHSSFTEVRPRAKDPNHQSYYLLGARPTWEDIASGLDAEREVTGHLRSAVAASLGDQTKPHVIFLKGPAGSGKSTILMRLAWILRQESTPCFFAEGETVPEWEDIRWALEGYDRPVVLCLDNAHKFLWDVAEWSEKSSRLKYPPIFVYAARTNQFERNAAAVNSIRDYREVLMPDLSDDEISRVLEILERENALGELRGVPVRERLKVFRDYARRQILVAMREATSGAGFDDIIADEFARLPGEAKTLYTIAALPSSQQHTIRKKELIASSPYGLADTVDILEKALKGIVVEIQSDPEAYQVRHPVIAEMVIDALAPREMLKQAYIGYLRTIAHQIPHDARRSSRSWQLFWRLLNHRNLYYQFAGNVDPAREIYESVKKWFSGNGHFWLQYGALEVEYGNLDAAENWVRQAKVLLGEHHYPVMATYAHLLLKKATRTSDHEEANRLREEGEQILLSQIAAIGRRDPYPFHILGTQLLQWFRWRVEDRQERKRGYERLKALLEDGVRIHPGRRELRELLAEVTRDYLMMAVPQTG